ncbi:hypothetical protein AVEN_117581-1 [Araneus ventricosus]|uniref:Uncharacterized protein n=1 Tax=Araneus ventricosus TaxID=182803 RepID=A0A4Y2N022_ARAVE|nr:hypothetical protein AVEN_117581-1 [Araneus ventricosus]
MANGHAYARGLRALSLSQAAIGLLILEYCEKIGFLSGSVVENLGGIHHEEVSVMHDFVRAEGTDNWDLHLDSVQRVSVHLHAAGHIHYAKSAHLYLQNMSKLKASLPDQEFELFVSEGYFAVRRSDKFW